jgi:hypothetical protein
MESARERMGLAARGTRQSILGQLKSIIVVEHVSCLRMAANF